MAETTRETYAAVGRLTEGLIYPDLVHGGMVEVLADNSQVFNNASRNAIRMVTASRMGDFHQESFVKMTQSLVSRRDVDASPANPSVTATTVPMDELISVKLNRRIGPVDKTLDAYKKMAKSARLDEISFEIGRQIASAQMEDWAGSALTAAVNALDNQSAVKFDATGGTLATSDLVSGLAKFGDRADRIVVWVMHSKQYYDLVQNQITANIDGVSNFNVAQAAPVTLNRPVLITDDAALGPLNSPETYYCLGLTQDAVIIEESEDQLIIPDVITGSENITIRLQGEFAYNVGLKGFTWDVANGGVNPTAATLGTGSNWDPVATSYKDYAGIVIESE